MKKHSLMKKVLVIVIIFTAAGVLVLSMNGVRAQKTAARDDANRVNDDGGREEVKRALRQGGYREVARVRGHYVGNFDPNWDWSAFDLEALTKHSAAVVVGAPKSSRSQLSADGQLIVTEYEVSVQEVIKGQLTPGGIVKVSLPGGKVEFEDGTSAELVTPNFEGMSKDKSYLLFLTTNKNGSDALILTGGPQGLFELPPDGATVKPHGRTTDPAVKEVKGKGVQSLLEDVRRQAEKWPAPGSCCN